MAITGAERNRRYREKKKAEGLSEIMKRKDRLRKQIARAKMSSTQLAALRLRQRENLRKFRAKSRTDSIRVPTTSSFPTVQAKAKALKKFKNVLPKNKAKQHELIQTIATDLNLLKLEKTYERVQQSLPMSVKSQIYEFYCRDDNSYQAPGKRDVVTVKENGMKQKLQKRYLLCSIRELYQLFIEEYPGIKVSLSSFQDLRPPNVLYKSSIPHNTCICMYHENVALLLKSLIGHIHGLQSVNLRLFIKLLVCDEDRESCMFSTCDNCANYFKHKIKDKIINPISLIRWTLWSISDAGRAVKVDYDGSVKECVKVLSTKVHYFLFHTFVKRQQSNYFKIIKTNISDKRCLLQVDYAQNFSIVEQNEIQSAHWSNKQISLFTAHLWTRSTNFPMVVVSDDVSHNKYTVSKCLEQILTRLQTLVPLLEELVVFSDGSASQFKQRYLFRNLSYLAKKFGIVLSWQFFATSHGKGRLID